jgi:hypothetical protein
MAKHYTRESDVVITCCRICSGRLSDPTIAVKGRDGVIKEVMTSLARDPSDRRSIRIVGPGGVGKTAVAEEVVRRFSNSFDRFRKTVILRLETGQDKTKGLSPERARHLQRQLLEEVSGCDPGDIPDVPTGRSRIRAALLSDRVLVVLDDVWPSDEGKLPVTMRELGERCRLLITVREVAAKSSQCHKLECLHPPAAAEIFDTYAREAANPDDAACGEIPEDDRNELIQYCGGLPLALKVLGSMAGEACRDMHSWSSFLGEAQLQLREHRELEVLRFSLEYIRKEDRQLWEAFVLLADLWDPFSHDRAALGCWLDAIFDGKSEEIFRKLARKFLLTVIDRDVTIHDLLREAAKGRTTTIPSHVGQRRRGIGGCCSLHSRAITTTNTWPPRTIPSNQSGGIRLSDRWLCAIWIWGGSKCLP